MNSPFSHLGKKMDAHFPIAHVRPEWGWVNDPNGPIWHRGRFHLFFQYVEAVPPQMGDVVWAHCSSTDLVSWEMHGTALGRSSEHPGVEAFWSGNTVEHAGRLHAFYAAFRGSDRYQPPRMTSSEDGGLSFFGDYEVVAPPEEGVEIFRDPYVWREGDRWRLLMGSGLADGTEAQVRLYESEDLRSWAARGAFASLRSSPGVRDDPGSAWECPQYAWELGLLFVGAWRPKDAPMIVLAIRGVERDGRLASEGVERADHGPDFYAPSVMRTPDGRYLLWGVIREGRDAAWRDETGWAGMLSLPREVSLEEGRLATRPARELQGLRGELCDEYVGTSKGATLANVPGAFELWLRLERPARKVSLALELGRDEVFSVFLDREGGRVIVDSDKASADARAHGGVTAIDSVGRLLEQDTVELRWFIDHSVSELFVADRVVATNRLFPVSEGPWRLRLTASETSGMEARLWALRNILTPGTDRAKPA